MDFTSDSRIGSHSEAPEEVPGSNISSSDDSGELNPEQERLLQLQDVKDSLLGKRNALVKEIEMLESKETPVEYKRTALLDLAELVPKASSEIKSSTKFQDGSTSVEDELRYKHDCLPFLNMDSRLSYMRETYPYANFEMGGTSNLQVEFTRRPNDYFQLELQLPEGPAVLSSNVRWPLRKLEDCSNPTAILQGCYEYDRLRCKRDEIFHQIVSSLRSKDVSYRISGSLLSLWKNDLLLQLRQEIENNGFFPETHLSVRLFKNAIPLSSPDVQHILEGLMVEYGVVRGILELCRSCSIY